ncbi:hypothetical protein ABNF97_09445 [Plantactinospora sp. B6F1]|uniref:hypothetical protein n=1 Tax=Plantactinospora sp. B6F1 TaxID=3158971 RepID=UPI0032D8BEC2
MLATTGAGIAYTAHVQRESDRQWCELFAILTPDAPPTTERGQEVAEALERRRQTLGCNQFDSP